MNELESLREENANLKEELRITNLCLAIESDEYEVYHRRVRRLREALQEADRLLIESESGQ